MRAEGNALRVALFKKTLELCQDALSLGSHAIAYQIVDGKFTIEEALWRIESRTSTAETRNEDKSENR